MEGQGKRLLGKVRQKYEYAIGERLRKMMTEERPLNLRKDSYQSHQRRNNSFLEIGENRNTVLENHSFKNCASERKNEEEGLQRGEQSEIKESSPTQRRPLCLQRKGTCKERLQIMSEGTLGARFLKVGEYFGCRAQISQFKQQ